MITKDNLKQVLKKLNFQEIKKNYFSKKFENFDCNLEVDFQNKKLIYPENAWLKINDKTTSNFKAPENFVVFECVNRLLEQWYNPKHIELEPKWQVWHGASWWKADVLVKDNSQNSYLIIECKTSGWEFNNAWKQAQTKPTQIFSYAQQAKSTEFISLYASDFVDNEVLAEYYLISLKDNEDLLKNNSKLKSFKDATSVEEIYKVWVDTYDQEYARLWLFENNRAYDIWKNKFSTEDLKIVSSKDIAWKYHEFATILRQHNVSWRENAFDKLVNLFLCKVVDEKDNSGDLQFYWKWKAYDDPFALQDRLQKLYSVWMKKFLSEDITYIDNAQIDSAFRMFKDKNATKKVIKDYFKELKFFTNNDFAFIDIHNEKLFYQNFAVFLKIIRIFQDIRLTWWEENQFLWDMFEWFLDQWVKQSEWQFFTPMPIVKFLINSLPEKQNPNVIDYACGAGHFLNEYASKNKDAKVVWIEKEYRLSKVSKVSAFMYWNDDMQIIYDDALAQNKWIENESFDVLIANPPYSVKWFLETLKEEDRWVFELTQEINKKSYSSNNAIECFFLEKSAHLLKTWWVAGIIVPSSILNKWNKVYSKTREIILKNFYIVAIYESWSWTFGKTWTNTVTLFLKKKETKPSFAEHFEDMVNFWFEWDFKINEENFKYNELLKKYCSHQEYDFEEYKEFLSWKIWEKILKNEIFKEYKTQFEKLSTTKNYKKKSFYKNFSESDKKIYNEKEFLKFAHEIEKDKLLYFWIASDNESKVLIVKTPSWNSEIKKFLGYEWSSWKWNEWIKYLASANVSIEDWEEELEEDDKRVLENISSLNNIETPLYNPKNLDDESKINYLIKKNFNQEFFEIPEDLQKFVSKSSLVDMLDFSRVGFDKAISLNPNKKIEIESKYELVKLGDVVETLNWLWTWKKEPFTTVKVIRNTNFKPDWKLDLSNVAEIDVEKKQFEKRKLEYWDIVIEKSWWSETQAIWRVVFFDLKTDNYSYSNFTARLRVIDNKFNSKYLYLFLNYFYNLWYTFNFQNWTSWIKNLDFNKYLSIKIPLPPLDIQEKIVNECEKIDLEVEKAESEIKESREEVEKSFQDLLSKSNKSLRLSNENIFDISIWKRVLAKEIKQDPNAWIPVYSANVFDAFWYINKDILKDFSKSSVLWWIDGDWMVNFMSADKPFYPTDHCWVLRIDEEIVNPIYLKFALEKAGLENSFSRSHRASIDRIKSITIQVPWIEEQNKFAKKIEEIEKKIEKNRKVIEGAKELKEGVLKRYL